MNKTTYLQKGIIGKAVLLLATVCLCVSGQAQTLASLERLHVPERTVQGKALRQVLQEVESQYQVSFVCRSEVLDNKMVAAQPKGEKRVEGLLRKLLDPFDLHFDRIERNVYLIYPEAEGKPSGPAPPAPEGGAAAGIAGGGLSATSGNTAPDFFRAISGTVTDEKNVGLPGVSVVLKGTTSGSSTDSQGKYSLQIPDEGGTLVFSSIGYVSEEVVVGTQSEINISLVPDIKSLSEVVVIGYGERERKDLTGAISSVNAQQIQSTPIISADQALQGRVSGVQITNSSGDPTAPPVIRIRGVGTTGNNNPLFVIDGIPIAENQIFNLQDVSNPLALINPADIESIDVLKDASAAAIYGVRASNGVIIITTKRGKQGKPRMTLDMYEGVQQVRKFYDVQNTATHAALVRETYTNRGRGLYFRNNPDPGGVGSEQYSLEDIYDPAFSGNLLGVNEDWQRAVVNRNAAMRSYNLGLSGGSENADYSVSGGHFKQESILKGRGLGRYTLNSNINAKVWKMLRFGTTLKATYTEENEEGSGSISDGSTAAPFQAIYNPANPSGFAFVNSGYPGSIRFPELPVTTTQFNSKQNWLALNDLRHNKTYAGRILGGFFAELEPLPGLKIRGNLGIDYMSSKRIEFSQYNLRFGDTDTRPNTYLEARLERLNMTKEFLASYTKTFGSHNVSLLGGALDQRYDLWGLGAGVPNLSRNEPEFWAIQNGILDAPSQFPTGENFREYWSLQGYIGRLSYNYAGKYYLDATIRRDGSSRFAPENRWGTFPSLAVAWRVSEEAFMKQFAFVSNLKVRAGWGQLGNQETAAFAYLSTPSLKPRYIIGTSQTAQRTAAILAFANRELGWETSEQTNVGIDAGFFGDRLTATVEYYIKNTSNILSSVRLPLASGIPSSAIVNAASVRNSGLELELGYQGEVGGVKYGISGNLTTVRNRVTSLGFSDPIVSGNSRTEVGQPIGYFYGYQTNGVFQNQEEINAWNVSVPQGDANSPDGPQPGDIRFVDNNGPAPAGSPQGTYFSGQPDGTVAAQDRAYLGKSIPSFFYGTSLNASWRGFDASVFLQGVGGFQIFNAVRSGGESMSGNGNAWNSVAGRWTGAGTSSSMPRAVLGDPNSNNRFSDRWVEDGGFLRVKNVQVGYTLPRRWLEKLGGMASLRIYVSGTNLAILTKYKGLDPEVQDNGNVLEPGVDSGGTPLPRVLTIGLGAAF